MNWMAHYQQIWNNAWTGSGHSSTVLKEQNH